MDLVLPDARYKNSYIKAVQEFQADFAFPLMERKYDVLSIPDLKKDFSAYVEKIRSHARGENLPEDFVPVTTYWLVENGEYIGRVDIRHRLTESLRNIGGHIGYDIRPSKRGEGYGSTILALALPKAKELGLLRVLVTCDISNTASRKIIEKNGGVLLSQKENRQYDQSKLRFWIDIT